MSVIIDNIIESNQKVDFLHWLETMGFKIRLDLVGSHIRATLVGTQYAWAGYGEAGVNEFTACGATKEGAIESLKGVCSGRKYHPNAKDYLFFVKFGRTERFPQFK